MGRERIVVVGGGAAGLRAAERLRELNFGGELVVVGEEPYRTYHRPAITKHLLTGAARPRELTLPVLTDLDATWRYGVRASHLEPEEHVLHLPGGEEIPYDGLVIATGAQARHLPGAPRHDPRVHVVRTIADAVAVQKNLRRGKGGLAVIGSGFLACELASAARALGRDATIVTKGTGLLDRVPGQDLGETVTALHEAHGVKIVTEAEVNHWVRQPDGIAMHLSTGQVVVASCVVLAVGAVPAVSWLRGSGLILDDGVMCDPTCHAIGAEDIVVAGDVARWPNLRFDSVPRRVEHWLNAVEMGRAAAENLLAGQTSATPFTPLPRFWTDQHGMRIQAAGVPALAQDTVSLAGSVNIGPRVTGYVSNGSLVGVVGFDSPRTMLHYTAELEAQTTEAMRNRRPTPPRRPARTQPEPAVEPAVESAVVAAVAMATSAARPAVAPGPPQVRVAPADMTGWIPSIRAADSRPPAGRDGVLPGTGNRSGAAHGGGPGRPSLPPAAARDGAPGRAGFPAPGGTASPVRPSFPGAGAGAGAGDRGPGHPPVGRAAPPGFAADHGMPVGHPSFPSMPAADPSHYAAPPLGDAIPGMPPVGHPSFPSLPAVGHGMPVGHPSFPSMPAVDPGEPVGPPSSSGPSALFAMDTAAGAIPPLRATHTGPGMSPAARSGSHRRPDPERPDPFGGRHPSFPLRRPTDDEMPPLRTTDSYPNLPAVGGHPSFPSLPAVSAETPPPADDDHAPTRSGRRRATDTPPADRRAVTSGGRRRAEDVPPGGRRGEDAPTGGRRRAEDVPGSGGRRRAGESSARLPVPSNGGRAARRRAAESSPAMSPVPPAAPEGRARRHRAEDSRPAEPVTPRSGGAHRKPEPEPPAPAGPDAAPRAARAADAGPARTRHPAPDLAPAELTTAIPPIPATGPPPRDQGAFPYPSMRPMSAEETTPGLPPIRSTDSVPGMPPARPVDTFRGLPPVARDAFPPVPRLDPTASSAGIRAVGPNASSAGIRAVGANASSAGIRAVGANASSAGIRAVGPNASSAGIRPVAPGASSARLRPVPPTGGHPVPPGGSVPGTRAVPPGSSSAAMRPVPPRESAAEVTQVASASSAGLRPVPPGTAPAGQWWPTSPGAAPAGLRPVAPGAPAGGPRANGIPAVASSNALGSLLSSAPSGLRPAPPTASSAGLRPVSPGRPPEPWPDAPPAAAVTTAIPPVPSAETTSIPVVPPWPTTSSGRIRPVAPTASSPGMVPVRQATASSSGMAPARATHLPPPPPGGTHAPWPAPPRSRATVTPPRGRAAPNPPTGGRIAAVPPPPAADPPDDRAAGKTPTGRAVPGGGLALPPPPAPADEPPEPGRGSRKRGKKAKPAQGRRTSAGRRSAMPPPGTVSALPPVSTVPGIEDPSRYEEITPTD